MFSNTECDLQLEMKLVDKLNLVELTSSWSLFELLGEGNRNHIHNSIIKGINY